MPANAKVGGDVHALVREVVCHLQAFDAPGDGARPTNGITDEVHALGLVDGQGSYQRNTHPYTFGLFTLSDWQVDLTRFRRHISASNTKLLER